MDNNIRQQWMNIMNPKRLKPNLEHISLYITLYEMLEDNIVQKPRDYYTLIDEINHAEYSAKVLGLYDPDRCSLIAKNDVMLLPMKCSR